jgi:hypothetical protein
MRSIEEAVARQLVATVRKNVTIDWTLRMHGYLADKTMQLTALRAAVDAKTEVESRPG